MPWSEAHRSHRMARLILADVQVMLRGLGPEGARWRAVRMRRPSEAARVDSVTTRLVNAVRLAARSRSTIESVGERELELVARLVDRIVEVAEDAGVSINVDRWAHNAREETSS